MENKSGNAPDADRQTLGVRAKLGYGVGDLAINLFFQSSIIFLLYFYTDIFGISAAAAATLFLVARLVDAVTDPMMGAIADRTRTKWGQFRPYLLWGAPPLAVVTLAMFTAPELSESGKLVYAYVTYILFSIAYTVVSIPYSSLTAVITDNSHERTVLTAYRMAFALLGGIIVGVGTQPLVTLFGGGALGFQITIGLYGGIAIAVLALTFAHPVFGGDLLFLLQPGPGRPVSTVYVGDPCKPIYGHSHYTMAVRPVGEETNLYKWRRAWHSFGLCALHDAL